MNMSTICELPSLTPAQLEVIDAVTERKYSIHLCDGSMLDYCDSKQVTCAIVQRGAGSAVRHQAAQAIQHQPHREIRRIFNNDQLIERFEKWLLICGKSRHTRINYTLSVRQFGRFLDKPLTGATKEDVRAFIASLYARGLAPSTMQLRLDSLRVFFDCLALGGQVRVSVPRLVSRRKLPQRLPHAKSEEVIERLIAAARTPRDRAILELGYA